MVLFGKFFALLVVAGLLVIMFKEPAVYVIGVILIILIIAWLIRTGADIFWKGKDNDWW